MSLFTVRYRPLIPTNTDEKKPSSYLFSFLKLGLLWVVSIKQMRSCLPQISKLSGWKKTTSLGAYSRSSDYFQFQTSAWACQFSSSKLVNMICWKNGFCWTNTSLQTESQSWTTSKESAWCKTTPSTKQCIIFWVSWEFNLENVLQDKNIQSSYDIQSNDKNGIQIFNQQSDFFGGYFKNCPFFWRIKKLKELIEFYLLPVNTTKYRAIPIEYRQIPMKYHFMRTLMFFLSSVLIFW